MKNILIIKLGAFGDFISAMGAIKDIRSYYSKSNIHLLTTPPYKAIAEQCPWIDNVIVTKRLPVWRIDELTKLKKQINRLKIDKVYDLQCSSRTNLYYQFLFRNLEWCGTAYQCSAQIEKKPYFYNNQTQLERLLSNCDIPSNNTLKPDLSWMTAKITNLLQEEGILENPFAILFHGCSKKNMDKRWPYYDALAKDLMSKNITPVSIPGPDEIEEAKSFQFKCLLKNDDKSLDFFETAEVCKKASFVIGNDTGPTHLAAFVGAKGLTLFGGHETNIHHFIKNSQFSTIKAKNLTDIHVDKVLDHINRYFL